MLNQNKIQGLMDFLRFRGDARLDQLAAQAQARHMTGAQTLADDDLDTLFAAGDGSCNAAEESSDDS